MSVRTLLSVALLGVLTLCARTSHSEDFSSYSGEQLFKRFCASCHGPRGEGDGPVAPYFKVAPPDLRLIARRHGGEFPTEKVRRIVDGRDNLAPHGTRLMPVWGMEFTVSQGDTPEARQSAEQFVTRFVDYLRYVQLR